MDAAELVRQVQDYGLDEVEASLYYNLSRLGPSRAAALADASGRKRTDVYRVLDGLVEKGFAEKTLERPAIYVPRPLEEALERSLALRRAQTAALVARLATVASAWPRPVSELATTRSRFTVHQGHMQVEGLLQRLIASAREEVVFAASADGLARLDTEGLRRALEARAEAGLLVRVLAKRPRAGEHPLASIKGVRLRYADTPSFYQMMAIDDREVALFVVTGKGRTEPGAEETVLWLSSSDVVLAQKALFDQAWAQGLPGSELSRPRPRQVQVLRGRWVRGARLREMAETARATLEVTASPAEMRNWRAEGIADAMERAVARGVTVVVRSAKNPGVPGYVHEPSAEDGCNLLAVADGVESLLSLGLADGDDPSDEWSVWSTHADLVSMLGLAPRPPPVAVRPRQTSDA
ncbi:MAG: helix-turn-helix domain-containing protein [Candidatus Thermoplasmatota archaeon]